MFYMSIKINLFIILQHVLLKLSALSTHVWIIESCTPLVNGCISDVLLNGAVQTR